MSSQTLLITELQSLSSETRRKHSDVREAAEKAISILRASSDISRDPAQSDELLRPIFMGCSTKNTKVITIALSALQRLITLKAVPQSAVPTIVSTMNECVVQGVDIQLRVLQTLLSLITNFSSIHGALLGDALLLCFKMQESKISVVSSTAAATLRQLVMFIIDKVVDEDRRDNLRENEYVETVLPNGEHKMLGPSALDAYSVLEDFCLLANSEKARFLQLGSLPKTFALELVESVLTNYHDLFRAHPELLVLLQHHLCPLLLKVMSDRPHFPLTLRSTRVVFILLKQFSIEFKTETEVFLALLIRVIGSDSDSTSGDGLVRPLWMRILAMEVIRGLCSDAELMRSIWERYDAEGDGTSLFGSLVSTLKRLTTEKPALLGVSSQMFGVGVSPQAEPGSSSGSGGYGFDVSSVSALVASAASGVVGMMNTEHGLDSIGSSMKLQCIDQLDKADNPPIPDAYIYLLGLQSLVSLSEGFAALTLAHFNTIVVQRSRAAGETTVKAPAALDLATLPDDQPSTKTLRSVRDMIDNGWPGLLAALSFLIATNLSDELFGDVLQSYQNIANVAGMLGLTTPRDAFLQSLAKFAIPSRVVSSLDTYVEPPTPRSSSALQEGFSALTGATGQHPGLSDRNMACLKVLIASALFLAGSLGESWYNIFETLQNADYVLTSKGVKQSTSSKRSVTSPVPVAQSKSSSSVAPGISSEYESLTAPRHALLADVDSDSIQRAIQRLFDSSKNMGDDAFHDFVAALCKLSLEMIGMQSEPSVIVEGDSSETLSTLSPTPSRDFTHRRRVSGIHLPRTLRTGDFGIKKLGSVSRSNMVRFVSRAPNVAWNPVIDHLLLVLRNNSTPHSIRLQASQTLDGILLIVPRSISSSDDNKTAVQKLMLEALARQVAPDPVAGNAATVVEIRKTGLETLLQILQSAGHTLLVGWELIFEMLGSVCDPTVNVPVSAQHSVASSPKASPRVGKTLSLSHMSIPDKGSAVLVRIAFQSLTLVCDSLSTLSPEHLRLCISTIGQFGRQADTNIALTAAGSLLWGVSDSIQSRRANTKEEEDTYNSLWMLLLQEMLGLCTDVRFEVRTGAIQTLSRTLQLYGATLSPETWDECLWKVILPLLDAITDAMNDAPAASFSSTESATALGMIPETGQAWDESKTLALQSIASIFGDFLRPKIVHLDSFEKAWEVFLTHVQKSFMFDSPASCAAALRCLERALKTLYGASGDIPGKIDVVCSKTWTVSDDMGELVLRRQKSVRPNQPEIGLRSPSFDQESLIAYVDVVRALRLLDKDKTKAEWPLERLTRLMIIFKGVITYADSEKYRMDVDDLTPVQSAVIETIADIDLNITGAPSLLMRDLSELLTLAYLGSFEVQLSDAATLSSHRAAPRVTYIALTKKVMPMLLDMYARFKDDDTIYEDETVEAIFSAYAVPIKLKYECPPASRSGSVTPLWKTATTIFLQSAKDVSNHVRKSKDAISDVRIENIWRHLVDAFRGGILADCRALETIPLNEQEEEEMFDLSLITALEVDVIPYISDSRVPDSVIVQLARTLHQGSSLNVSDEDIELRSSGASAESMVSTLVDIPGTTMTYASQSQSRERFCYWCLDLLFLICSDVVKDDESLRKRIAALSLPLLLHRCRTTLITYLSDEAIRGSYPFPRAREEELVYILKRLLSIRLWPGSLFASMSDSPTTMCIEQPVIVADGPLSNLFAEATKRSTRAHLFQLYSPLCRIAALPRKPPVAWSYAISTAANSSEVPSPPLTPKTTSIIAQNVSKKYGGEELDARSLAALCLEEIGKELCVQ